MDDEQTDAKIAALWPDRWAKATRSKQRSRLRRAYKGHLILSGLIEAGMQCGNCRSFNANKHNHPIKGSYCEAHSSFEEYQLTKAGSICVDWSRAIRTGKG